MVDYGRELEERSAFIRRTLEESGAKGLIFGNSGGKDSALVGILCQHACENTLGVILPCQSKRNFGEDMEDALALAQQFGIRNITIDLTKTKETLLATLTSAGIVPEGLADGNINPRLRMTVLYAIAQTQGRLVVGTGNRSEIHMGYFTKWGDGAYDLNPIADLTVREIYEFLHYLHVPENILRKAPSAGLMEGQTDEKEMGVSYHAIDGYLLERTGTKEDLSIIEIAHQKSRHKRILPLRYGESAKTE